jgi:crotonobetainyl-CoA:carnitine CoA-transferase CaiB-like acyl-CoA transferase
MHSSDDGQQQRMTKKALSGVRVLDLTRILAGPFATQMLGDLGAEIIKIEKPLTGDDSRRFGPPFMQDAQGNNTMESSFYLSANRNKKSVTVDIAKPEGQALIRQLALQCDVLVENFKVGDLKRYGLDYAAISQLNPRLIYCSITGFGQTGPYRARPGYDAVFQAMSGLMSVTGLPDDVPGGGPMKTGPSLADIIASHNATAAILAALYSRDANGGTGQHIDIALLDTLIAATSHYASHYLMSGVPPIRRGTEGNGGLPGRLFQCADAAIMIVAGNNAQFVRLCAVLGNAPLGTDPRFVENAKRVLNRKALDGELEPLFLKRQSRELLNALNEASVPAGPVNDIKQAFEDEQVQSREMAVEIPHSVSPTGKTRIVRSPLRLSGTPIDDYLAPPQLGQNTHQVLQALLALDDSELAALAAQKVI